MSKKSNKTIRTVFKSKKIFVLILLIVILGAIAFATMQNVIFLPSGDANDKPYYTQGKGGDYKEIIDTHEQAIAAWKRGDKQKAKELAQRGLDENKNLTTEQQKKIPDQMNKIFDLYDISQGSYEN